MSQEQDPRKVSAKQSFLSGETIASIAATLGVNRRTIERWADEGNWREQKQAQKVVPIGTPLQPKPESTHNPIRNPASIRSRQRREIDEVEIVEDAIDGLSFVLTSMSAGPDEDENGRIRPIDTRGIGSVASALVKLLEYRRKLCPPTIGELAKQAIDLGHSPDTFFKALADEWQLRA